MREINQVALKAKQAVVLLAVLVLAAGCSSTPGLDSPSVISTARPDSGHLRERLNQYFLAWHGVPYKIGGQDKHGIDCSGFVQLTYKNALGINIPRSTDLLLKTGKQISRNQLAVGDLVFFKTGFSKQHVGIYVGNGQFIHASSSKGVMKSSLKSPYWSKHYWKSNRVLSI
ncbi:MAG: NlpC/P60 family protein [Gammaproteobacteria bacterium]|jgi:cell wall-associated NlpC family hydrolase